MIKKYVINKITVTTMCLVLLLMFYLVPTNNDYLNHELIENKNQKYENIVYLLDEDNYVAKVVSYYDKSDLEDIIKEKIDILTYGLPGYNNFYSLIPKNTILNKIKIEKNNLYLDFNKELLNISKYLEEEMIEAIVYTMSEINGIDNIYISTDNVPLKVLPNSKKELDYPLTRRLGINKEYNIDNLNNISKTTVVFSKKYGIEEYFVPITKVSNDTSEKIDIIIEELKSGVNSQNNLYGYINENVSIEKFNISKDKITLVFNEYIYDDVDKMVIHDKVKSAISNSIFENYDVNEVIFSTKDNKKLCNILKK